MDQKDTGHLSFLENYEKKTQQYVIPKEEEEPSTITAQQVASTLPAEIERIRETLLEASSGLLYVSEAEQPYEFIFIPNEEITELPNDCTQFKSLIKEQGSNLMITEEVLSSPESNLVFEFQNFF